MYYCENDLYYCENDLKVSAKSPTDMDKFLEFSKGEDPFDFDRYIPMPDDLRRIEPGSTEIGYEALYGTDDDVKRELEMGWKNKGVGDRAALIAYLKEHEPRYIELAEKYKANVERYGHRTQYSWAAENWGTKYNVACVQVHKEIKCHVTIQFITPLSPPLPVITKASELFPMLDFELKYYECGEGFHGVYFCKAGKKWRHEYGTYFGDRGGWSGCGLG